MRNFSLFLFFCYSILAISQSNPDSIEKGKCYIKVVTQDVYQELNINIEVTPSYKKYSIVPAQYKTTKKRVLVKSAHNSKEDVSMKNWNIDTVYYTSKKASKQLKVIPASFSGIFEAIEVKPKKGAWSVSESPDCQSSNPDDCRMWCYKSTPSEYATIPKKKLIADSKIEETLEKEEKQYYTRMTLNRKVKDSSTLDVPAAYKNLSFFELVEKAKIEKQEVPAEYKTLKREVLVKKGGLTTWEEIECEELYARDFFGKNKKYYDDTEPYDESIIRIGKSNHCGVFEEFLRDNIKGYHYREVNDVLYFYKYVDEIKKTFKTFYLIEIFSIDSSKENIIKLNVKYFKTPTKGLNNPARTALYKSNFEPLRKKLKSCINGK